MHKRAFTLFELLIVCAILALLNALLLPAFTEARVKAKMSGDLSNLRQIGAARALYMMDHDEREVWSTIPLVRAGYLPQEMVRSPLDPTIVGRGNLKRRAPMIGIPNPPSPYETAYKDSYGALLGELDENCFNRPYLRQKPGFGWLVNSNNGRPVPFSWSWSFVGPYHRLLPDGAVVHRVASLVRRPSERQANVFLFHSAFVDYFYTYEQWLEWVSGGSERRKGRG